MSQVLKRKKTTDNNNHWSTVTNQTEKPIKRRKQEEIEEEDQNSDIVMEIGNDERRGEEIPRYNVTKTSRERQKSTIHDDGTTIDTLVKHSPIMGDLLFEIMSLLHSSDDKLFKQAEAMIDNALCKISRLEKHEGNNDF